MAIEFDIRIGGDDARFKFHGASYGRAPGGAVLPRIVGDAKAKELLFTRRRGLGGRGAAHRAAESRGAADEVVDDAVAMAERIAANSPVAVRALKEIIDLALPIESALAREHEVAHIGRSEDSAERFRTAAARVIGKSS